MANGSVGIMAPSSVVPRIEFKRGTERLKDAGFKLRIHPQCKERHLFYAGDDESRASALFDFAMDPGIEILWSARGGYGAPSLLPLLEKMTAQKGMPERKLLVGYSDSTALLEFARTRWGWPVLHAPMPGLEEFSDIPQAQFNKIVDWVRAGNASQPWGTRKLKFVRGGRTLEGELIGGNLSVWAALAGTPYRGKTKGKILFLEDISESPSRIDRMIHQIAQSGGFEGVQAVILGTFTECEDRVPQVLSKKGKGLRAPLRTRVSWDTVAREIFGWIGEEYGIPVAYGLPVGHGAGMNGLPLGAKYRLGKDGSLKLLDWKWKGL